MRVRCIERPLHAALAGAAFTGGAVALAVAGGVALSLLNSWRPPQPIPWGTVAMGYECGFSADRVRRTATLAGRHAAGEFYVVDGRVVCPFGERLTWTLTSVFVAANGRGPRTFLDPAATAALDRRAAEPHTILGAEERLTVVFDLPSGAIQPALVFEPAVAPGALADAWLQLKIYAPQRFNLRIDGVTQPTRVST